MISTKPKIHRTFVMDGPLEDLKMVTKWCWTCVVCMRTSEAKDTHAQALSDAIAHTGDDSHRREAAHMEKMSLAMEG